MDIEQEIEQIKRRNQRVEQDKAWEVSWTRRVFISVMTYAAAAVWLLLIRDSNPLLKAIVPVAAYLLSTFSLPALKNLWLKNNYTYKIHRANLLSHFFTAVKK